MSHLEDMRREREGKYAEACGRKDFQRAFRHAAWAAEYALRLAEVTRGKVSAAHVADGFRWIETAEKLKEHVRSQPQRAPAPRREDGLHPAPAPAPAPAEEGEGSDAIDAAQWLVRERPQVSLGDIAGMEEVKAVVRDVILTPLSNLEAARRWGVSKGGGVLMFGPPGNGKTTLAKAIAHELDCPFFMATGADIRSKWSGEAEKRLRVLLQAAQKEPVSVVFIDDLDGLLPRRGGMSVVDNRVVCQFLAEVGGFRSSERMLLLLGATNKPWEIDEAVFRTGRFDEKIFVGLPDAAAREEILRNHFRGIPLAADVDLKKLGQRLEGYTGSDLVGIAMACKRAGFGRELEGGGSAQVEQRDFEKAIERIPKSVTSQMIKRYEEFKAKRF